MQHPQTIQRSHPPVPSAPNLPPIQALVRQIRRSQQRLLLVSARAPTTPVQDPSATMPASLQELDSLEAPRRIPTTSQHSVSARLANNRPGHSVSRTLSSKTSLRSREAVSSLIWVGLRPSASRTMRRPILLVIASLEITPPSLLQAASSAAPIPPLVHQLSVSEVEQRTTTPVD